MLKVTNNTSFLGIETLPLGLDTLAHLSCFNFFFFFSFSSQIHYNIVDSHELKLEEDIYIKKTILCLQICSFKCYHYIYKKFLMSKVNKTQLTATMRYKKVTKVLKMGNNILYARYKSNAQELFFW